MFYLSILALRMPDGSNLIVSGRTSHQIALADPTVKAVKTTLIDYDPAIHTDEWVQMTNAGEHIINRTATTEHFRTYFTHNPITHAQAIEQGLVPIDPKTRRPSAAYTKGRQLAEQDLAAKEQAEQQAAAKAAAEAKAQAEKALPGKTKWATPTKKAKPLSDSETRQTLISVAGQTASKDKTRYVLGFVSTQRSKGTEYTVATDGRRLTVISQPTYKEDTDTETHEFYDSKGVQYKKDRHSQPYPNWRQVVPDTNKQQASTTIDLSYYGFLAKGSVKSFDRDPQSPSKKDKEKRIATPLFQDGQNIVFNVDGHRAHINPIYMRDLYKQMQELGKKIGFPPTLKVHYFDKESPLVFTAEHNGITFQSIIMPLLDPVKNKQGYPQKDERGRWLYETPAIKPGDIILGEQPTIYGEESTQDTGSFSMRAKQDLTFTSDNTLKAADVKQSLARLAGQELTCINSPIVATVNSRQRGKLVSPAARDKSIANGFTQQQHLSLASRVDDLYKYAIPLGEYNDKNGRANLKAVFRFASPVQIDGNTAFALLTLKRVDKDNLYSLELEEINQLGGTLDRLNHLLKEEPSTIPLRAAEDIVAELAAKVKEYFGENALPPITATEAAPLFQSGEWSMKAGWEDYTDHTASFSLRRRPERNAAALLNERETTLLRVANYIKREALRQDTRNLRIRRIRIL